MLLILAGDIYPNPGPTCLSSTLNFSLFNIRSASSISYTTNKPALLQEFISYLSLPFITPEILSEKSKRSKLEYIYRKNGKLPYYW